MRLSKVIAGTGADPAGAAALEIAGITCDSRQVEPGFLFAAIPGFKADGHDFIAGAAEAGAVAALTSRQVAGISIPQVQVPDVRLAMAQAAAAFYNRPSSRLRLVGVTGTNGKTTTTFMLHSIISSAGGQASLLGGVEYRVAGESLPAARTTPESVDLQRLLAQAADGGDGYAVIEVSSHGIELQRTACLEFEAAVFTNLTRDHLDLHKDMESYYRVKSRLFLGQPCGPDAPGTMPAAIINTDDEYGRRLATEVRAAGGEPVTFGARSDAVITADRIVYSGWRTSFELVTPGATATVELNIPGSFSLANALAAAAAAHALGYPAETIAAGLNGHRGAPGRFEAVDTDAPFQVVIDYAHNEDGLARAIETARKITPEKLIVVFGCPGERDQEKRPVMGRIAGEGADLAILTTDDCYGERPETILDQAEAGLAAAGASYRRVPDRREAIAAAVAAAAPGDTVLIAGKGHETRQILPDGDIPFSDREVAREAVADIPA
ncbi:MAG: UDP-N-acetylmuramoyl-L-alanyl-D-glutamate--2,6-diaminopimelate ligase [Thermoleophilia bacterium]